MGLTPVYDDSDGWFNAAAARDAFELVMKMDEDEARAFTTIVVAETLWDTIEKNQRTLQRHLDAVISKRATAALEVLSKRENGEQIADEIAKAVHNPYYYGYQYDESKIHRDRRTGQFKAKIKYTATKPLNDKVAVSYGIPTEKETKGLKGKKLAEYQQAYMQISNFLSQFDENGLAGDTDFLWTIKGHNPSARAYTVKTEGTGVPAFDPSREKVMQIEARPVGLTAAGASFGLVGALGGNVNHAAHAAELTDRFNGDGKGENDYGFTPFADDWVKSGENPTSSNDRLYSRVHTGSKFLGTMALGNPKLEMAAQFGMLVGQHGPQAEKVLGPGTRRAMYRYRGTEKTPDTDLAREYDKAMRSPENADGSEFGTRAQRLATLFMSKKVPDQKLYDLNLKSGHTPPSEGILIDKDGKLVSQSIGYGDDHYLPFNLKHLGRLKGGEYIRTRSVGGPTSEDIYTGLVTGAQRLTVISRSGIFVVQFDDTFRGGRRYNDKAKRMVNRYEKLVDAVKSQQVIRQPLEPSVRQAISDEVNRSMSWASPKEKQKAIMAKEEEYRSYPRITPEDEKAIDEKVGNLAQHDEQAAIRLRQELRNNLLESKSYNFKLNGDGYAAALKALQEQFPYYIADTRHVTLNEAKPFATEMDRGYVKPRHNRPHDALEGFYDSSIAGKANAAVKVGDRETGKFHADTADYQNWKHNPQNHKVSSEPEKPAEGGEGASSTPARGSLKPMGAGDQLAGAIAHRRKQDQFADAALALRNQAKAHGVGKNAEGKYEGLFALSDEDFKKEIQTKRPEFDAAIEPYRESFKGKGFEAAQAKLLAYDAAKGMAGGKPFNKAAHLDTIPDVPFDFTNEGPEFSPTGDVGRKRSKIAELAHQHSWMTPGLDKQLDDADFKKSLRNLQEMRKTARDIHATGAPLDAVAAARQQGLLVDVDKKPLSDQQISVMLNDPDRLDQAVVDTHRAWALNNAALEAQGHSIDQLLNTPKGLAGDLPKAAESVKTQPGLPPRLERTKELTLRAEDYEEAADRLETEAEKHFDSDPGRAQRLLEQANQIWEARTDPYAAKNREMLERFHQEYGGS